MDSTGVREVPTLISVCTSAIPTEAVHAIFSLRRKKFNKIL
jgi:hypothetical protein